MAPRQSIWPVWVLASFALSGLWVTVAAGATRLPTTELPRNARPSHYDVSITPQAAKLRFDGKTTVIIDVLMPTSRITLNATELNFSSVTLAPIRPMATRELTADKITVDAPAQTATFEFRNRLPVGAYRLSMTYDGKIGTQASGLFAIDYDTAHGKQRALFTQFENSDARRFIPCWDEPAYKATFDLDVTVPSGDMAISNMPVRTREEVAGGFEHIRFASSPTMSTYLLFFGLGDFDRVTTTADGTEIGVVVQKGASPQAAFALESARAVLHEYNDYFDIPYPLPKLDNIGSPGRSQFFGAMENWGAIYTFEYLLLLDPSISTQSDRQMIFSDAAHEMAHQWFGDLVTMQWWDDLWLNEGFASWMAARTMAKLHPEWHTDLEAIDVRYAAMTADAQATTHPVVQHVATVEQASQAFDNITYAKGEAVIRMLETYTGIDAWRDGVRRYLKSHAYGNTVSDDLWREIEAAAGKPITTIAHEFTLQPGVPMIRVAAAPCADGGTVLHLVQGEYTADRPDKVPLQWHVPVMARSVDGALASTLVAKGQGTLTVPGCGPIVVNAGQSGYYRTLYGPAEFASIRGEFARLSSIDSLGILDDAWTLGMAGLQPVSSFFDLVTVTPAEAEPQVWQFVAEMLRDTDDFYRGFPDRRQTYRQFAIHQLEPLLTAKGWETHKQESTPTTVLREQLIATLGALGDKRVIAEANRRYGLDASDHAAMPQELRQVILKVVAQHADAATWEKLHQQARDEKTPLVKDKLYRLLSTVSDDALAAKTLELALTAEPGATNSAGMISAVARQHPDMAFDFAVSHLEQVSQFVDGPSTSRYFPNLATASFDPSMIQKLDDFARAHIAAGSRRPVDISIARIRYATQVRALRLPELDGWLAHQGS